MDQELWDKSFEKHSVELLQYTDALRIPCLIRHTLTTRSEGTVVTAVMSNTNDPQLVHALSQAFPAVLPEERRGDAKS